MKILGITWSKSVLVSFDPYSGEITEKHAWLPEENFRGFAYNYNQNLMYALSQVNWNLYSIDPLTRNVAFIGKLNISNGSQDIGGLTYDPIKDTLYTTVGNTDGTLSELVRIDMNSAQVTVIGKIVNGFCFSLCWSDYDSQIKGFVKYGSGAGYPTSVVSINPDTAAMTTLFQTSYDIIMGLAKKPGGNQYFSWINATNGHFYGEVNLTTKDVKILSKSDSVGVTSDAMIFKNFCLAPASNMPCSFTNKDCPCR